MEIISFNVENLFSRVSAMALDDPDPPGYYGIFMYAEIEDHRTGAW